MFQQVVTALSVTRSEVGDAGNGEPRPCWRSFGRSRASVRVGAVRSLSRDQRRKLMARKHANHSDARDIQSAAKAGERCLLGGGACACMRNTPGQRLLRGPHAFTRQGLLLAADRVLQAVVRLTILLFNLQLTSVFRGRVSRRCPKVRWPHALTGAW